MSTHEDSTPETDDVEGHGLQVGRLPHRPTAGAEENDDVEGHGLQVGRLPHRPTAGADESEDVEGHVWRGKL